MIEEPVLILDDHSSIWGILRYTSKCRKLVLLLPTDIGVRTGAKRIYVQIARQLVENDIASLTVDIPPNGDSFDNEHISAAGDYQMILIKSYYHYLNKIVNYLKMNFRFNEITLLTFSAGCIPILVYAVQHHYSTVILISPDICEDNKLYLENIHNQIGKYENNKIPTRLLVILGGNDVDVTVNQRFWNEYENKNFCSSYTEFLVPAADHYLSGWRFKVDVSNYINYWLSEMFRSEI